MLIVGIAGGTGSGKTTVVKEIVKMLPRERVAVIPQDSYYYDSSHIPMEERQKINFDHPSSIEFSLLTKHVEMLRNGQCIEQPTYSYLTCSRLPETIHVEPADVIIIEGILILTDEKLRNRKLMGVNILSGLTKKKDKWEGGKIYNPKNGKNYKCSIWLEGQELKVRGYIGFLFETQTWKRKK